MGLLGKAVRKRGGQIYDDLLEQLTPEQKRKMQREAQERAMRAQAEAIEDPTLDRVQDGSAAAVPAPVMGGPQRPSYNMGMRVEYPSMPSAAPAARAAASGGGGIAGRIRRSARTGMDMVEDGVGNVLTSPLFPVGAMAGGAAGAAHLYGKHKEGEAQDRSQQRTALVFDMVATGKAETLIPLEQLNARLGTNYGSYAEAISDPDNGQLIGEALISENARLLAIANQEKREDQDRRAVQRLQEKGLPVN